MANKMDNLMPIEKVNSSRTREQHSRDSRKGGIRSGEVRRENATMKETLKMLLNEEYIHDGKKTGKTYRDLATLGFIKGAIKGNAQNYRVMLEVLGELKSNYDNTDINNQILNIANLLNNPKDNRSDKDVQ